MKQQLEKLQNTVLMLPERHIRKRPGLKQYLQEKETHAVGPYIIVVL